MHQFRLIAFDAEPRGGRGLPRDRDVRTDAATAPKPLDVAERHPPVQIERVDAESPAIIRFHPDALVGAFPVTTHDPVERTKLTVLPNRSDKVPHDVVNRIDFASLHVSRR